jgi:hypothetical protein
MSCLQNVGDYGSQIRDAILPPPTELTAFYHRNYLAFTI